MNINERELVRDLISCLSNVKGKFIDFNEKKGEFLIKGSMEINVETYLSIKTITELAFMFKEIND